MKCILITVLVIFGSSLYGQTDSIEKVSIYNKMASKEIEQEEFLKTWQSWNQKMKEIKQYPNLPLDRSGKVHYSFVNKLIDFNKEKLFNRTLEWLSINYGLVPSYIYSNAADGKIIFRNSLDLKTGSTCNYTSIISIKNEKIMTQFNAVFCQSKSTRC